MDKIVKVHNKRLGDIYVPDTPNDVHANSKGIIPHSHIIRATRQYITTGSIVFDVGTFIGMTTIQYAQVLEHIGGGKLIGIEANPLTFECVQKNMGMRKFNAVTVEIHNLAAYNEAGLELNFKFEFAPRDKYFSWGGFGFTNKVNNAERDGTIVTTTIDSFLSDQPVSLIKIDVEGLDYDAIYGAQETMDRHKPAIIFECGSHSKLPITDFAALAKRHGYSILKIYTHDYLMIPPQGGK